MRADIHVGDARTVLKTLPSGSVHCCVTSPPYFGLRDYGVTGQLGLEPTLDAYIEAMVEVFREVRRVLRDDGTLWLNCGDSYAATTKGSSGVGKNATNKGTLLADRSWSVPAGLKPKDLMMVPARLALALQADGWWLRSEIVWAKKAPMPESVTDRPTSSHEKIFLLSKNERYYYDGQAVRERMAPASEARYAYAFGGTKSETLKNADATGMGDHRRPVGERTPTSGRNLRNVWHLGPEPFPEAHFATFPTEIPRRAILAGTSEHGVCSDCGAPWVRETERGGLEGEAVVQIGERPHADAVGVSASSMLRTNGRTFRRTSTKGWAPSCPCAAGIVPANVLDPFSGAGTTGVVAGKLGRDYIGIELNPVYAEMSERRILREVGPLLVTTEIHSTAEPGALSGSVAAGSVTGPKPGTAGVRSPGRD